jgi:hypothetical protein
MLPGLYSSECKDAKTDMHMFTSLTLRLLPLRDVHNVHNQVYGVDYFRGKPHSHFLRAFTLTAHHISKLQTRSLHRNALPCHVISKLDSLFPLKSLPNVQFKLVLYSLLKTSGILLFFPRTELGKKT